MEVEAPHHEQLPVFGYGDRIRLVRSRLDMTVDEFADAIRATTSTVSRHEHMTDPPTRNTWGLANSIELRYGKTWPGGLAAWIVTGDIPAPIAQLAELRTFNPKSAPSQLALVA